MTKKASCPSGLRSVSSSAALLHAASKISTAARGLLEVGVGVDLGGCDLVLVEQFVDALEEPVEGGVLGASLLVADPHRHAEALGDGALEEFGFGLLELRAPSSRPC